MSKIRSSLVIVGLLLSLVLLVVAGYYGYWYFRAWQGQKDREKLLTQSQESDTAPDELTTGFDPSKNAGIYNVIDIDQKTGMLTLAYEWPRTMGGKKITTSLACRGLDYKVFDVGAKAPRLVSKETMLEMINNKPKDQLVLTGMCSNRECTEINSGCIVRLLQEKYVAK